MKNPSHSWTFFVSCLFLIPLSTQMAFGTILLVTIGFDGKGRIYDKRYKSANDLYAALLKTSSPEERAVIIWYSRKDGTPFSPVLTSLFLSDKREIRRSLYLPRSERICDFASDALDVFYHYPFGKLPEKPTLAERDARIKKWREWFQRTMQGKLGRDAGPPREKPKPSIEVRPMPKDKQAPKRPN